MPRTKTARSRGSSPLTRGKRHTSDPRNRRMGLIPAHAGKTPPSRPAGRAGRAHPRSRGENTRRSAIQSVAGGSSPLTRGKPCRGGRSASRWWLIPAHAGKTRVLVASSVKSRAHPRSRGENSISCLSSAKFAGSSPLTRGKHRRRTVESIGEGLIPAHAGKTWRSWCQSCWWGAHPRSRGENRQGATVGRGAQGSSPLTRGKRKSTSHWTLRARLIPAHAGKTPSH